ncbi:hypothetical protein QAD02_022435 [Eretmocerus hayati]|uniref:Uncharacterized protein n=1 Tax=Eretmocerus hayati TaxID=131215 RepID=A0ACC2PUM2_9HYME|nr:hypothetical protein QAD02_022435 [Eretmocerus hayati]
MELDLDDDDLDIQIIEVKNNSSVNNTSDQDVNAAEPPLVAEKIPAKKNPVEEHLVKQLHIAQNQIDQAKSNIELIESVTQKIVQSLTTKAAYRDEDSSDSDCDLYTTSGEPLIRKKKNDLHEKQQVLNVLDRWQRIVDNKWVIGVVLENTTSW